MEVDDGAPAFDPAAFSGPLAQALDAGDVAAVQLRLKDADDAAICEAAEALLPVCRDREVPLIMNDRPDLAEQTGCDGAHVGQQDQTYAEARKAVGDGNIVGVTCHDSRHLAMQAAEQGADYVAFGAFFPTTTKTPKGSADIDILEWWSELMVVPCVAIGGITPKNCPPRNRPGDPRPPRRRPENRPRRAPGADNY